MNRKAILTLFISFLMCFSMFFINFDSVKAMGQPNDKGYAKCTYDYIWSFNDYESGYMVMEQWRYEVHVFQDTNGNYNGVGYFRYGTAQLSGTILGTQYLPAEKLIATSGPANYNDFFMNASGLGWNHYQNKSKWNCPEQIYIKEPGYNETYLTRIPDMYMDPHDGAIAVLLVPGSSEVAQEGTYTFQEQERSIDNDNQAAMNRYAGTGWDIPDLDSIVFGDLEPPTGTVDCNIIPNSIMKIIRNLFLIIQVIGVLLLVGLTVIEFVKVITTSDEDGLKGAIRNTFRRIIMTVLLLVLPLVIIFVLNLINLNAYETENGKYVIGEDGNPICK